MAERRMLPHKIIEYLEVLKTGRLNRPEIRGGYLV